MNWGPDEPAPLLICDEIGSRQDATAAALQMLVNAGLLTPDGRLRRSLRSATGLPSPDPDTAREPATADPMAQPEPQPSMTSAPVGRARNRPAFDGDQSLLW